MSNKGACFTSILLFDFRDVSVKDVLTVPLTSQAELRTGHFTS